MFLGFAVAVIVSLAVDVGVAVGGAQQGASLRLVKVVGGLSSPVYATQAPGQPGALYVVEQDGRILLLKNGRRSTFLDIRSLVVAGGEQGLLGLAFPADYRTSKSIYVNFSAAGDGATVVSRIRVAGGRAQPATRARLLRVGQPYPNHNGGHLAFGRDGKLWIGLGDGGAAGDPENRAQNPDTLLGKLFTLDISKPRPTPTIVAFGLRNPWRYSFDRATGDLWIGDVGQGAIEEIDVLRAGTRGLVNFGWKTFEGSRRFSDTPLGPGTLIAPIAEYSHSEGCSVTGGYVYRGRAVPALRGRYVYGDYCSGTIWSFPAGGGTPRREPIEVERLVSFGESLSGELYVVSQDGGVVYRIAAG
jgi:glucose/arabinose dehydrogenase